jgi:YegS/Rv2252/BmrU family lipid kinase
MKVLFIVNPTAGKGRAAREVTKIKTVMEEMEGVGYDIVYTEKPGHATELARQGGQSGYDIIFAVGGDGTVNEVMNGIAGTQSALAVVPGGSGNDFIRSLSLKGSTDDIIKRTVSGVRKKIDLGVINGRYFANISSVGFDAEVVLATQKAKKFFLSGSAAYLAGLIVTILRRSPYKVRMVIDEGEVEDVILLAAVANGKYYGGGMMAAPEAIINDGLFDICCISRMSRLKMLILFPQFMKGKHKKFKEVRFFRSRKVYIESENPIPINVDGEVFRDNKACFELLPGELLVAVPDKDGQ